MMDCYILKSSTGAADGCKTLDSLRGVIGSFKDSLSIYQINREEKKRDWYCVFYDNECIGNNLLTALPVYLKFAKEDCIILIKYVDGKSIIKCPKIFRKDVKLRPDALIPFGEYSFLTVLDGYVWNHDQDRIR